MAKGKLIYSPRMELPQGRKTRKRSPSPLALSLDLEEDEDFSEEEKRSTSLTPGRKKSVPTPVPATKQRSSKRRKSNTLHPSLERTSKSHKLKGGLLPPFKTPVVESTEETPILPSFGDYQFGGVIGRGGYAKVFKGFNMRTGQSVAIKEIDLTNQDAIEDLQTILGEIRLLKKLKHPNIVHYIDYFYEHEKALYIVLEFIENGSLKDTISHFGPLPEPLAARYSFQVLQGISYLHLKDILHGDIKGANILTTKDGICKLADFGVARQLSPNDPTTSEALGTTYWSAPEILSESRASKAADVWSFGITLIELLTGKPPHRDLTPLAAVRKILESEYPPLPKDISIHLKSFLKNCFHKDPERRSTISDLLYHPWIQKFRPRASLSSTFLMGTSSGDLQSLLASVNAPSNLYGMDFVKDEEMAALVKQNSQLLVDKFDHSTFVWTSPQEMDQGTLEVEFCDLQAENRLLVLLLQNMNKKLQQPQYMKADRQGTSGAIERLEAGYSKSFSDFKTAQLIYRCTNIPYDKFPQGKKGILLMNRVRNNGDCGKWSKRWILLQDDFLFCYKPNKAENPENPVMTILLRRVKINLVPQREIGRANCFLLTTASSCFYFAAANPDVLMKWTQAIADTVPWYLPGNVYLEDLLPSVPLEIDDTYAAKRTRTGPGSLIRKIKVTPPQPFPGIPLKSAGIPLKNPAIPSKSSEPFPGIPLKSAGIPLKNSAIPSKSSEPFPGIPLKSAGIPLKYSAIPSKSSEPFPGIPLKSEPFPGIPLKSADVGALHLSLGGMESEESSIVPKGSSTDRPIRTSQKKLAKNSFQRTNTGE